MIIGFHLSITVDFPADHLLLTFSEMVIMRPKHLHSKLEAEKEVYKGEADIFYIRKFLDASVHGLAGHMTPDNQEQFKQPLCVVYYKVDWKRNAKGEVLTSSCYVNEEDCILTCTVEPRLSGLVGTSVNSPDNQESG